MSFPIRPGRLLDAALMNSLIPVTIQKSATESRTSTTIEADSELVVQLPAGVWDVHMWVSIAGTATANSGVVTQWGLGSGVALVGFRMVNGPAAGSSGSSSVSMRASVNSASTSIEYGAGSGFAATEEWAVVSVPLGGGTVRHRWGKAAAGASAQVGVGSYIRADRIG